MGSKVGHGISATGGIGLAGSIGAGGVGQGGAPGTGGSSKVGDAGIGGVTLTASVDAQGWLVPLWQNQSPASIFLYGCGTADVWKKDHFGWEYKGKRKDLAEAYRQLDQYRGATYDITNNKPAVIQKGKVIVTLDGKKLTGNVIVPQGDGKRHKVVVPVAAG